VKITMTCLDNRYRIGLSKTLCGLLGWKKGDKVDVKLVNIELVQRILSGEINVEGQTPLIIFNVERKCENGKKNNSRGTIFD